MAAAPLNPRVIRSQATAPLRVRLRPLGPGSPSLAMLEGILGFHCFGASFIGSVHGTDHPRSVLAGVLPPSYDLSVVLAQPTSHICCAADVVKSSQRATPFADPALKGLNDVDPVFSHHYLRSEDYTASPYRGPYP